MEVLLNALELDQASRDVIQEEIFGLTTFLDGEEYAVIYWAAAMIPFYIRVTRGGAMSLSNEEGHKLVTSKLYRYATELTGGDYERPIVIGDIYYFKQKAYLQVIPPVKVVPDEPVVTAVPKKSLWKFWNWLA